MNAARLKCFLTRNSKKVIIYRRGPSKWTQMILWDLVDDKIKKGQWLHGSVHYGRSDVSPDGSYVATSISKQNWQNRDNKEIYSWIAISKPPFFSSLITIFTKARQNSGGYFIDKDSYHINDKRENLKIEGNGSQYFLKFKYGKNPNENEIRYKSLGWKIIQPWKGNYKETITPLIISKEVGNGYLINLEQTYSDFSWTYNFSILHENKSIVLDQEYEWLELDCNNRIIAAKEGKIYTTTKSIFELNKIELVELADFNNDTPQDIKPSPDYF